MSKKKKNAVAVAEAAPVAPEVEATSVAAAEAVSVAPQKKGLNRFFALLTLIAVAALALLIPFATFKADWTADSKTIIDTVKALFAKDNTNEKLFGVLPALFAGKELAVTIANLLPYLLLLFFGLAAIVALVTLFSGKKCGVKTALIFVIIAAILQVVAALFVSMKMSTATKIDVVAIIVIVAAIVLLIIFALAGRQKKDKKEKPVEEPVDPVAEMLKTFRTEEVIEAYAYEGGPVAGIEIAEEVFPTLAKLDAQKDPDGAARNTVASLLGNGFDAFLITLNEKEKNEFIDLYVLKCRGIMPEIPGYVVGGDNKDFFNKVFIYLGQYREKIPGDLLAKMYSFSMKI